MRTYDDVVRSVYGQNRSSFWSGFAGLFDFRKPALRRLGKQTVRRSTAEALTEDWAQVSKDLERAFRRAGCR